uniref:Uncharacterized protein n=1 Tax=Arundo donax TaxID=35708 RepID=A0A0A9B5C3_ARUDO
MRWLPLSCGPAKPMRMAASCRTLPSSHSRLMCERPHIPLTQPHLHSPIFRGHLLHHTGRHRFIRARHGAMLQAVIPVLVGPCGRCVEVGGLCSLDPT